MKRTDEDTDTIYDVLQRIEYDIATIKRSINELTTQKLSHSWRENIETLEEDMNTLFGDIVQLQDDINQSVESVSLLSERVNELPTSEDINIVSEVLTYTLQEQQQQTNSDLEIVDERVDLIQGTLLQFEGQLLEKQDAFDKGVQFFFGRSYCPEGWIPLGEGDGHVPLILPEGHTDVNGGVRRPERSVNSKDVSVPIDLDCMEYTDTSGVGEERVCTGYEHGYARFSTMDLLPTISMIACVYDEQTPEKRYRGHGLVDHISWPTTGLSITEGFSLFGRGQSPTNKDKEYENN